MRVVALRCSVCVLCSLCLIVHDLARRSSAPMTCMSGIVRGRWFRANICARMCHRMHIFPHQMHIFRSPKAHFPLTKGTFSPHKMHIPSLHASSNGSEDTSSDLGLFTTITAWVPTRTDPSNRQTPDLTTHTLTRPLTHTCPLPRTPARTPHTHTHRLAPSRPVAHTRTHTLPRTHRISRRRINVAIPSSRVVF